MNKRKLAEEFLEFVIGAEDLMNEYERMSYKETQELIKKIKKEIK